LRIFEGLGTAFSIKSQHYALLRMALLHFLWHTPREVEEATLLVKISTEIVFHMVYPNQSKQTTTLQF
jgi:hypothetical protein